MNVDPVLIWLCLIIVVTILWAFGMFLLLSWIFDWAERKDAERRHREHQRKRHV